MTQQSHFCIYIQKNCKQVLEEICVQICVHPSSQQHYSQQPKGRSTPSVHRRMSRKTRCDIYRQWNITSRNEEGNPNTCYDMGEPSLRHWNKPATRTSTAYSTHRRYQEQSNSQRAERWLPGLGEGNMGSCCLRHVEFQFCKMKNCGDWLRTQKCYCT